MKKILLLGVLLSMWMFGCGNPDGALSTSNVTATIDTVVLDSDIIKWTDAVACTGASIPAADSVNVAVKSVPYANTGNMGLPVRIEMISISYSPANPETPAMSPEYQAISMEIPNGSSVTVPVRVATQEQKESLVTSLACGGPIYKYFTKITLNVTEVGTNRKSTIYADMDLRFADFVDK